MEGPFEPMATDTIDAREAPVHDDNDGGAAGWPQQQDRGNREDSSKGPDEQRNTTALQEMCSCLIGMRPDKATDAIVDIGRALALRKPFAIVPCCIFAST